MTVQSGYSGNEFSDLPKTPPKKVPLEQQTLVKVSLFAAFVLIRAIHPTVINASKTVDERGVKGFAYEAQTVNIAECVVSMVVAQLVALRCGGYARWRSIWRPAPMRIFSFCGFMFGLGDFLEMQSLVSLSGGAYQILLQSKLLITALMSWGLKGSGQTALQWNILALVMLSMSVYMCLGDESAGGGGQLWLGALCTLLKVFVSCLGSVLTDKYVKQYSDEPVYVQAVQIRCARLLTVIVMVLVRGKALQNGFFHGWDWCVMGVFLSFTLKAWSTLYLLVFLDSVLKSIGEAVAVLVIYFMEVCLPAFDATFQVDSFLAVMVVILAVVAYIMSKGAVEKAKKYDARAQ